MTAEFQNVVVCRLLDGEEMRGIAQAALEETIALVTLDEPPPEGEFVRKPYHYGPLIRKIEELLARSAMPETEMA